MKISKFVSIICAIQVLLMPGCKKDEWRPAGDRIQTPWAESVSPSCVHPEYPRPRMIRDRWKSLNGLWDYSVTNKSADDMGVPEGKILVPFCIESSLSGVGRTIGEEDAIWYGQTFRIPFSWKSEHVLLHFEAVDWETEVWVNGLYVGAHTGGYTAFDFDITPYLKHGSQQLKVKVKDATDNNFQPRGKQVSNPSGIWYTAVSGIWQSVWLEPVPETRIADYSAYGDIDAGTITVKALINGALDGDVVSVSMADGIHGSAPVGEPVILSLNDVRLWSPESPYLYDFEVRVNRDGETLDKVKGYTAMRKISVKADSAGNKRLALNDEILFQYGPLDQGWWPDGLYTAPSEEAMRYDLITTKEYGFNMIRKHVKVEPSTWYRACDELGVLVWQDMPSFADNQANHWAQGDDVYDAGTDWPVDERIKVNYYKEWEEIMDQHINYPCIVVWVPFNEAWGQFDTREVAGFTSEKDPTRLVNHASGGNWVSDCPGDILDSHYYPHPQMRVTDSSKVNVLGEYGGIGLPLEGHLWQSDKNWGYVKYADGKAVTEKYIEYSKMLQELVKSGCSAAVYTQTTDVEGEVNGLMTYDRKIKKLDVDSVRDANLQVINILTNNP